jgi:hypothetical protein
MLSDARDVGNGEALNSPSFHGVQSTTTRIYETFSSPMRKSHNSNWHVTNYSNRTFTGQDVAENGVSGDALSNLETRRSNPITSEN